MGQYLKARRGASLLFILTAILTACASTGSDSGEVVGDLDEDSKIEEQMDFKFPLTDYRRVSRGFQGRHRGVDVSAWKGTPIYAAEAGWVTYSGRRFHGYGKLVIIEHSKNWATFYAHMSKFAVKEGMWVKKGELIGYVGNTGRSRGSHLHFEVRYKRMPIDPLPYFKDNSLRFVHLDHSPASTSDED